MKTVTYPLRLPDELYKQVQSEAEKRHKKLSELFREIIGYGLESLPPMPDTSAVIAETWDKLGLAPEIDYGKL